ncbi:MAG: ABC transporter permease [Oscillospiraceae bacterium]
MNNNGNKIKSFVVANIVPILFLALSVVGIIYSGVSLPVIFMDVIARMDRNLFLVLSLLVPVLAGMGLNFGIVLGAMTGQFGLFIITLFDIKGMTGLLVAILISVPLSILLGWLTGILLNKTKGQEMIAGMILGFFAMGIYQFIFLFFIGGVIPLDAPGLMLSNGIGVRNTIDISGVKYAFDNVYKINVFMFAIICAVLWALYIIYKGIKNHKFTNKNILSLVACGGLCVIGVMGQTMPLFAQYKLLMQIPVFSFGLIVLLCIFIKFIFRTKLGQDMRATGHNMEIAEVSGINVNKVRIIATILSMVFAGIGQIIFLQNLGNISMYNAHENVAMFAAAALLIGGASISKATVSQAIVGTFLFHLLFNVSPMAGKNLFGDPAIGEYFRVFIAYGVIAVTLALHAWKQAVKKSDKERAEQE